MRRVRAVAVLAVVAGVGCHRCPECGGTWLSLEQWCGETEQCLLDGQVAHPVAFYDDPNGGGRIYYMAFVGQGVTLTIPLGQIWPEVGTSDDLGLSDYTTYHDVDFRSATLLFDATVPPEGMCSRNVAQIWCHGIPPTVQRMDFRYDDGPLTLQLDLYDAECEPCPG